MTYKELQNKYPEYVSKEDNVVLCIDKDENGHYIDYFYRKLNREFILEKSYILNKSYDS